MLDEYEIRLECLRLAACLHENDVPEVTQLLATSDALLDYVCSGRAPPAAQAPVESDPAMGNLFTGFLKRKQ